MDDPADDEERKRKIGSEDPTVDLRRNLEMAE